MATTRRNPEEAARQAERLAAEARAEGNEKAAASWDRRAVAWREELAKLAATRAAEWEREAAAERLAGNLRAAAQYESRARHWRGKSGRELAARDMVAERAANHAADWIRRARDAEEALYNLAEWAVGNRGRKDGNPYGFAEVREALAALDVYHGGTGEWQSGMERAREVRPRPPAEDAPASGYRAVVRPASGEGFTPITSEVFATDIEARRWARGVVARLAPVHFRGRAVIDIQPVR